jgi:polyisoprenoid-binding protein YceI
MRKVLLLATLITSSAFADGKLVLNVGLNPAGSFQATTEKIKGNIIKKSDGSFEANKITVSVESMKTGINLRDEHFWKHLGSASHPKVTLTNVKAKDGKGTGQLEVAGTKRPITIDYIEKGNTIEAKFKVKASDFKLPKASYLGVGVEDDVQGEVNLPVKTI